MGLVLEMLIVTEGNNQIGGSDENAGCWNSS